MSVLDLLATATGVYWGKGAGPQDFVARVVIGADDDGSLTLEYEAWSGAHGLLHVEAARVGAAEDGVTMVSTSDGSGDTMVFREGEPGVFGSTGPERVGLVITCQDEALTFAWWWPDDGGGLRERSRAIVRPMRPSIAAPQLPGSPVTPLAQVPWPGVVLLCGPGAGVVAQRLAQRLAHVAVVRTDLFDKAVVGTTGQAADPALRHSIATAVVRGYAGAGHPVIVHGSMPRADHERLVSELAAAGVAPVRLVELGAGEDYGDVARMLIEQ